MWLDEVSEVVEMFRGSFPLSFLFFIPILILISPVGPTSAAHDFAVYRMQQYDLQGSPHGCRNALVNVEARSINAAVYTRKCVIAKLKELTIEKYKEMIHNNAGGLLLLLPKQVEDLTPEDREHLLELEFDLMEEDTQTPVYIAHETDQLNEIYDDVKKSSNSDHATSAVEALLSAATINGFQLLVSGPQAKSLNDFQIVNIQGKLAGFGIEEQLPTIAIVAHYDAYGIAPSLSFGADSNASGVAALLELARLFSKLYTNTRSHAKFNLLFLLSGAGKFNFQGTKRWLEDQIESGESGQMADIAYVLCLDTLGSANALYAHVSKPPKEASPTDILFKNVESIVNDSGIEFKMVHKKINLAEDYLAWEHERFSIRRMPAFTISHLDSYKSPMRNTILDTRESVDTTILARNIQILAESLARQIYNLSNSDSTHVFTDTLEVDKGLVSSWLDYLSSRSRAAQLLAKDCPEVATLEQAMNRYLKEVKRHTFKADKRDPECIFYSGAEYTMNAYSVKPAIFDLFLALGITAYLLTVYLVAQNFCDIYYMVKKLNGNSTKKIQ